MSKIITRKTLLKILDKTWKILLLVAVIGGMIIGIIYPIIYSFN